MVIKVLHLLTNCYGEEILFTHYDLDYKLRDGLHLKETMSGESYGFQCYIVILLNYLSSSYANECMDLST